MSVFFHKSIIELFIKKIMTFTFCYIHCKKPELLDSEFKVFVGHFFFCSLKLQFLERSQTLS